MYHASKDAVRTLSKLAAVQYVSHNIHVNSVHPGFVDSPMTAKLHSSPGVREERESLTPIGRIGTPEDIAWGNLYLASDESSFVTGAELVIDTSQWRQDAKWASIRRSMKSMQVPSTPIITMAPMVRSACNCCCPCRTR